MPERNRTALSDQPMKLQPDKSSGLTINAYGEGWIEVNGQKFFHSLTVSSLPGSAPGKWDVSRFADLKSTDFDMLSTCGAELVIFGSGQRLRFPQPAWLRSLVELGIGLETMDTPAACRTYNILASEGRKVVVALLLES
jgi:uncharacterized protein